MNECTGVRRSTENLKKCGVIDEKENKKCEYEELQTMA